MTIILGESLSGEDLGEDSGAWINSVFSAINPTNYEYLKGIGQRFYTEYSPEEGLELLYEVLGHPLVMSESTKLFQEVLYLENTIYPSGDRIIDNYVTRLLDAIDIEEYFKNCLNAYITGFLATEIIWGGSSKNPNVVKLKTVHPKLLKFGNDRVYFKKGVNSSEFIKDSPQKFLKFTYSANINFSPIGDGVGKVLFYVLKERAELNCLLKNYIKRGVTPTLILKAESGTNKNALKNLAQALNSSDNWKTVPVPKGISVEALTAPSNYEIYQYALSENEKIVSKLISGESIVGTNATTGQRGAAEASNLRKARAIGLARAVLGHINRDLIQMVVAVKFGPRPVYPELRYTLPTLNKLNLASVQDAIAVVNNLGYTIAPSFFENNYGLDIINNGADVK